MGLGSIWHWLLVLLVVFLVFGTRRVRNVGEDLGRALRGFRRGLESEEDFLISQKPLRGSVEKSKFSDKPRARKKANKAF